MKKIILALSLIVMSQVNSQEFGNCATKGMIRHAEKFNRPGSPPPQDLDTTTPYVINAYFTLIRNGDGSVLINPAQIDTPQEIENKFLDCIRILNMKFNQYHIYFKYIGYSDKSADLFPPGETFEPDEDGSGWEVFAPYKHENAMNFYFINYLTPDDPIVSTAIFGGTESAYLTWALDSNWAYQEYLRRSLIHQVGHNLSLYHTHETGSHLLPDDPRNDNAACERVTRDPDNEFYNADYAGDEVTDTPAQPDISEEYFLSDCSPWNPLDATNCFGENYPNNIVKNYMNIRNLTLDSSCWDFTPGQVTRMRHYIRDNVNYEYLEPMSVRGDVASLYEPFYTQVFGGDVITTEDMPDSGGAMVCRLPKYKLRFQPGYKQIFTELDNGTVTAGPNEQFNYDNRFGHAIGVQIPSINEHVSPVGVIEGVTQYLCGFEPYVTGMVYSMAVLGEMNITVKELNEIEVKDPDLYDKLMERYYYILKKFTASGAKVEQVFYKY